MEGTEIGKEKLAARNSTENNENKECGEVASVRTLTAAPLFFAIESYIANLVQCATLWRILYQIFRKKKQITCSIYDSTNA
jgi:hypothetical protein